jgi:hypothetical protein
MVGTGEALGVLEKASDLDRKIGYFRNNAHRMRYARFRKLGMFTGSGAIEGGIKAIVVRRTKQSGMHWTVEGAADVIALSCQHAQLSDRQQDSDTKASRPSKIIPNKAVMHPTRPASRATVIPGR